MRDYWFQEKVFHFPNFFLSKSWPKVFTASIRDGWMHSFIILVIILGWHCTKKFFYEQLLHIKIQSETMKVPPLPKGLLLKLKQMPPFFHCVENGWQNLGLRLFKNQGWNLIFGIFLHSFFEEKCQLKIVAEFLGFTWNFALWFKFLQWFLYFIHC